MRILVVAVGGLSVLATGRVAAQPGPTAPMNVAVPAATGDPDEPGTRSDSTPEEVCVAPLADIDVNRTSGGKHRNRKSLRIGPWSSMGSTGSTGTDSCTMQVAEQAVNTAEGMAVGAVYLSGVTTCRSGSSSSGGPSDDDSGNYWSFLKFDTSAAAHVSSARLRLFGARSSNSEVCWTSRSPGAPSPCDFRADVWSASGTSSWRDDKPGWHLQSGGVLDSVTLANDKRKLWHEWDVTDWVLRERAAGRHVVTFVLGGNGRADFHSREAKTNPPELVLLP